VKLPLVARITPLVLAVVLIAAGCGGATSPSSAPSSSSSPPSTTSTTTAPTPGAGGNVALNVPVSGRGGFNYTQGSYLEGFEFTAKSSITVTAMGAYDSNLCSLTNGAETFVTVPVAL